MAVLLSGAARGDGGDADGPETREVSLPIEFRVGDVAARLTEIVDDTVDLVVTSPPFLALRSYLPDGHCEKGKEIGLEPTPGAFIDTLLGLTAEWGRVLAPHGSICVELGDTYSGSGGAGGDYRVEGLRAGQNKFQGSNHRRGRVVDHESGRRTPGEGWPLAKSMCLIPHLYAASLAYGRNVLTGATSPAGLWRVRNVICWARPNPPVGAIGDKFRPATSYIVVATRGVRRYFDLDAVREKHDRRPHKDNRGGHVRDGIPGRSGQVVNPVDADGHRVQEHAAGAPPLDWQADDHPADGDWLWRLATRPYRGAHFATFPDALPQRLIEAMCPRHVCTICGRPRERLTEKTGEYAAARAAVGDFTDGDRACGLNGTTQYAHGAHLDRADYVTLGWSHCGCGVGCRATSWRVDTIEVLQVDVGGRWVDADQIDDPDPDAATRMKRKRRRVVDDIGQCADESHWRIGVVLDPFAGSGTTLGVALGLGRHAIGIDLDARNSDLARQRCGLFLDIDVPHTLAAVETVGDCGGG